MSGRPKAFDIFEDDGKSGWVPVLDEQDDAEAPELGA